MVLRLLMTVARTCRMTGGTSSCFCRLSSALSHTAREMCCPPMTRCMSPEVWQTQ
jgi:hypothetical protein